MRRHTHVHSRQLRFDKVAKAIHCGEDSLQNKNGAGTIRHMQHKKKKNEYCDLKPHNIGENKLEMD